MPNKYYNDVLIDISQSESCQLINRKEGDIDKQKGKDFLSELKSIYERILKITDKLKLPRDTKIETDSSIITIDFLNEIRSEYSTRIDLIEREVSDIEEIKLILERDLTEIIQKEKQYEEITSISQENKKLILLLEEKTKIKEYLTDLAKKYTKEILFYYKNLSFIIPYLDASQNITQTELFSIINFWVIAKKYPKLEKKILEKTSNKCLILKETPTRKEIFRKEELPPSVLSHNRILEPFVRLVKLYGIPNYYEIDPTIIIAITFPLIFGLMFGDIGQGLVLMIGSGILALITKRTIAKILFYCGIGAIFAGFLYGEFFGFYLPDIWHGFQPLMPFPNRGYYLDPVYNLILIPKQYEGLVDNITFMLKIAIFIGYIQLSSGFLIQFVNNYKKGEKKDAWLITIPSFSILSVIVFILFVYGFDLSKYFVPSSIILNLPPIILIIIPFIILLIAKPLILFSKKEKKSKEIIGESVLRAWEVGLSTLANVPSYARIFAFVMIHWGLNTVFQKIGSLFNNIYIYSIIFGIGTAFIILLEAIVVSAATLRLHFYEWFSKFYEGNGTEFKPFKLPKDAQSYPYKNLIKNTLKY